MALPEIGSSSSSPISGHTYDVYSNFRGTDNRYSFTEHLNKALVDANFTTFFSDEKIEIKEGLKPDLESAIKASRASVIVLSKNFATSAWFLEELVQILEQRMTSNHIVVPIYYRIESTEVEKVHRTFREELARILHEMKFVTDTSQWALQMDRKGKALAQLADLRGILVNDAGSHLICIA